MPADEGAHAAQVGTWFAEPGKSLTPARLARRFEWALDALWQRAQLTLGEVTLAAITDRVLYTATEKYPFLSTLKIDGTRIRFEEFRAQEAALEDPRLADAVRFVLVEFLTVIGNLTGEILTPALHTELSMVAIEEPARSGSDDHAEGGTS